MEKLLTAALGQGLYAGMFVFLLLWVLKKNDEREKNYQALIGEQTEMLQQVAQTLEEMNGRLDRIEAQIEGGGPGGNRRH